MAEAVHCLYCFDVLAAHLHRTDCPEPPFPTDASFPLFVTWSKQNQHGDLDLRGCIGCLSPLPITDLAKYALTSALKDRRFSPIDARELSHLHCTVSLLTSFEVACSLDDWTIGPHGVMIDYVDPTNQARSAVYLPDVIPEQGWNKAETVDSLVRKSGYTGQISASLRSGIKLTRFQSTACSVSYETWLSMRDRGA
mmetsp:Transcript_36602/g.86385  ORF Transcript_36602/g.86385 Transcript_36602/m.86385 type:complete len:196 (-) Transcript_36602:65-652(-)